MAEEHAHTNGLTPTARELLRQAVSYVESTEETIREMNADKAEYYKNLKAQGFDVKALKRVVARRRKEKSEVEDEDSMVELYEGALIGGGEDF